MEATSYHLALFAANNPLQPFARFDSSTPFHSPVSGQKVQIGTTTAIVQDVKHFVERESTALHCGIMLVLASPAAGVEGGTNPVPWPWKGFEL